MPSYYELNKEKRLKYQKEYNSINKSKILQYQREYWLKYHKNNRNKMSQLFTEILPKPSTINKVTKNITVYFN